MSSSAVEHHIQCLAKGNDSMFIPKRLESVKYEGKNLNAYPIIEPDAAASEKVYALLCNKNAA